MQRTLLAFLEVGAAVAAAVYFRRRYLRLLKPMHRHDLRPFRLIEKTSLAKDVRLLVFSVPGGAVLNLSAGQHIQIAFYNADGDQVLRSYTPTESGVPGRFDILMKVYPGGKMGGYLDSLQVGDVALMRGPTGRVSYTPGLFTVGARQVPCRHILMLAGGTGITPMSQIVKAVLRNAGCDRTTLTLIVASSSPTDVLLYHELCSYACKHPAQFKLVFTVSRADDVWQAKAAVCGTLVAHEVGRISRDMVLRHSPPFLRQRPFPDWTVSGYCGPPSFEACAKGVLEATGYSQPSVNLFRW